MEASAKTGFNARKMFIEAGKLLHKDYLKYRRISSITSDTKVRIKPYNDEGGDSVNRNAIDETKSSSDCAC